MDKDKATKDDATDTTKGDSIFKTSGPIDVTINPPWSHVLRQAAEYHKVSVETIVDRLLAAEFATMDALITLYPDSPERWIVPPSAVDVDGELWPASAAELYGLLKQSL